MTEWTFKVGPFGERHKTRFLPTEDEALGMAKVLHDEFGQYTPIVVWGEEPKPLWIFMFGEKFRRV